MCPYAQSVPVFYPPPICLPAQNGMLHFDQVKRSRQLEKENKFEQFKKQQKLHPEYAGVYADAFLATPQEMHFFRELLVFHKQARADTIIGMVQLQPHTTMRELRLLLRDVLAWVSNACFAALVAGAPPQAQRAHPQIAATGLDSNC